MGGSRFGEAVKMTEAWEECYGVPAMSPPLFSKVTEHHKMVNVLRVLRTQWRADGASCLGLIFSCNKKKVQTQKHRKQQENIVGSGGGEAPEFIQIPGFGFRPSIIKISGEARRPQVMNSLRIILVVAPKLV